ncbi:MAG TPA: ABC transporter permease [Clostridiales bacterium]|nr:ABC transporter permease [Clostridiales bacterium]
MSLFMIFIPFIMAAAVNIFAPGIEDTTVNIALIKGENPAMAEYLDDYANISFYKDLQAVENRVLQRDHVVAIVGTGESSYILTQGNESAEVTEFTRLLKSFYEYGRQPSNSTAVIKEFGVKTPPIKMLWANIGILMMTVLAGMLISLNIVDEKMDNTISAINVAPISRTAWIFGKSMIGMLLSLIGCIIMVLIMGVAANVNFIQLVIFIFIASLISIMIGFLQGLNSDDVMTAVGSTKIIFLPLAASVAGYEFLAEKWQWTLYWSPYYWIYKGNIAILNGDMTWLNLLLTGGIVLLISAAVYAYTAPRIRKGLEH